MKWNENLAENLTENKDRPLGIREFNEIIYPKLPSFTHGIYGFTGIRSHINGFDLTVRRTGRKGSLEEIYDMTFCLNNCDDIYKDNHGWNLLVNNENTKLLLVNNFKDTFGDYITIKTVDRMLKGLPI